MSPRLRHRLVDAPPRSCTTRRGDLVLTGANLGDAQEAVVARHPSVAATDVPTGVAAGSVTTPPGGLATLPLHRTGVWRLTIRVGAQLYTPRSRGARVVIGAKLHMLRDAALLGARCVVAVPADQVPGPDEGWTAQPEARASLLQRLHAHEQSGDVARLRLCDELGLDTHTYWLVMLCAAVEMYPEAAAAVSLLAEDARVQLPTPTVVARLLRGILDVPFGEALSAALDGGAARRMGLVEVLEPTSGLPHSQHVLRFVHSELTAAHDDPSSLGRIASS